MLDFDERDLFSHAEGAGFGEVHLDYEARVAPLASAVSAGWGWAPPWEVLLRHSPNPKAPTLEEAMNEALDPEEAGRLAAHLRPLVDRGEKTARAAVAYLRAVKTR